MQPLTLGGYCSFNGRLLASVEDDNAWADCAGVIAEIGITKDESAKMSLAAKVCAGNKPGSIQPWGS